MSWVPSHLPHDNHLGFQQSSFGIVVRESWAVVREGDGGLRVVQRRNSVVEGLRGEAEPAYVVSAAIVMLRMVGKRKIGGYIDGEPGLESVVFNGLERLGLLRGTVKAERQAMSNASTIAK